MRAVTILGFAAWVSAFCGAPEPSDQQRTLQASHQAYEIAQAKQSSPRQMVENRITVYAHVIRSGDSVQEGQVSRDRIDQQMVVLNEWFKDTVFAFDLVNVSDTVNGRWRSVVPASQIEYEMRNSLRKGGYADLNLYFDTIGEHYAGYATFPDKASDRTFAVDGVVIDPDYIPGGSYDGYNTGKIAVHEVGHWLGLFHTFQAPANSKDGCIGPGDHISDTPAEFSEARGCPASRDTCTGEIESSNPSSKPGEDPIHNHMDYSDDACRNTFTIGQKRRMETSYKTLRISHVPGKGSEIIEP